MSPDEYTFDEMIRAHIVIHDEICSTEVNQMSKYMFSYMPTSICIKHLLETEMAHFNCIFTVFNCFYHYLAVS